MTGMMRARWIAAVAIWAGFSALSGLAGTDGETTSYRIGAIAGRMLGSLAIALVIRWIYVRVRGGGRPVKSPWLFVIAANVSLLLLLARIGGEEQQARADCERIGTYTAAAATAGAPASIDSAKLSDAELRAAIADFGPEFGRLFAEKSGIALSRGEELVGVVMVLNAADEESFRSRDFIAGFRGTAPSPRAIAIDGHEGVIAVYPDNATVVVDAGPCAVVMLAAEDEQGARAAAALVELPDG